MAEPPKAALVASFRAALYDLLAGVFEQLPDRLLPKIRSGELEGLISARSASASGFRPGLALVSSYRSAIEGRPDREVITELSVDRTAILRGTGHADMVPPNEALYRKRKGLRDSVLEVRRFYRRAGLVPAESVREPADYLCVELDFMKQLCLRERGLRDAGADAGETVRLEEEFLRVHLGSWSPDFCRAVEIHAATDFYRGFGAVLAAHIGAEMAWLSRLTETTGKA